MFGEKHRYYGKTPKDWMSPDGYRRLIEFNKSRVGEKQNFYGKKHKQETLDYFMYSGVCHNYGDKNGFWGKSHSEATKKKIGEAQRVRMASSPKSKGKATPVKINGILYPSVKEAIQKLGVSDKVFYRNIKRGIYIREDD